jgi:hypothetical protein
MCTLFKIILWQLRLENERSRACVTGSRHGNALETFLDNLEETDHVDMLVVDGRIVLNAL